MELSKNIITNGKRLLIEAALKLTADTRNLNGVSLRELAREAGLNPNTFYRHFKNLDELGLAIIDEMSKQLRQPLRDLRRQAADSVTGGDASNVSWINNPELSLKKSMEVNKATVRLFFNYVAENSDTIILGVRELHGASPLMRRAIRHMMQAFANDMAEDIQSLQLLPPVSARTLLDVAETISREMFQLSMDYIEQEQNREEIIRKSEKFIVALMLGTATLGGYGALISKAMEGQPALLESFSEHT